MDTPGPGWKPAGCQLKATRCFDLGSVCLQPNKEHEIQIISAWCTTSQTGNHVLGTLLQSGWVFFRATFWNCLPNPPSFLLSFTGGGWLTPPKCANSPSQVLILINLIPVQFHLGDASQKNQSRRNASLPSPLPSTTVPFSVIACSLMSLCFLKRFSFVSLFAFRLGLHFTGFWF